MITKELRESAVELNTIFQNCSQEVLKKIPHKFRKFLEDIASTTYKFNYDKNKSLNEQNLKPKTRRLLALIYKDYLCTTEEKEEYIMQLNTFFKNEEKYNSELIFKKIKKVEQESKEILIVEERKTFISRIIKFIQKLLRR